MPIDVKRARAPVLQKPPEPVFAGLPGRSVEWVSAGNGGRRVAMYVPPGIDWQKPVRVVTYFGGIDSTVASTLQSGVLVRLKKLGNTDNAVYVFPEKPRGSGANRFMQKGESFKALQQEAHAQLGRPITLAGNTVVAFSNGGSALQGAIASSELVADRLVLLDCLYESGTAWWRDIGDWTAQQKTPVGVRFARATNERARVKELRHRVEHNPLATFAEIPTKLDHHALPGGLFSP